MGEWEVRDGGYGGVFAGLRGGGRSGEMFGLVNARLVILQQLQSNIGVMAIAREELSAENGASVLVSAWVRRLMVKFRASAEG